MLALYVWAKHDLSRKEHYYLTAYGHVVSNFPELYYVILINICSGAMNPWLDSEGCIYVYTTYCTLPYALIVVAPIYFLYQRYWRAYLTKDQVEFAQFLMEDLLSLGNCVNENGECGKLMLSCLQCLLIICPIIILVVLCYLLKQLVFLQLLTIWDDITTARYWL